MPASTILIGVGNPVVTDDAVGITVARLVADALGEACPDIDVSELCVGGLALMEAMVGYDRAVIVDAMVTGAAPGTLHRLGLDDLCETRHACCAHDTTLTTAMECGRALGLALPGRVDLWGIEAADLATFSDQLTPVVERAVPRAVDAILATLTIAATREVTS